MSAAGFSGYGSEAWLMLNPNNLYSSNVTNSYSARGVINLNANTKISDGDGSKENPFVVE